MASTDESDGSTVDAADRATEQVDATQILPGDDITVIPDPHDGGNRRRVAWIVGAVAVLVLLSGAAVVATRDDDPNATVATNPTPTTLAETPNAAATTPKRDKPATTTIPTQSAPPGSALAPVPVPQNPVVVAPQPTVPPPTAPPPTVPGPAPASSLTWTAPPSVTIKTGQSAVITVRAHNPAAGVVSLPHPLSCAPTLDHSEICAQVMQQIPSGQSAGATWTISAEGIAPGKYTLNYAGLLKIPVTVTA